MTRIMLYAPYGTMFIYHSTDSLALTLKLNIKLVIWLGSAFYIGIGRLCVQGDSMLIIKQVSGDFALKKSP